VSWHLTDDVGAYADHVWDLLARDPAGQTVALTIIESARGGHRWSDEPMLFGWFDDGEVRGAVSWTPPYELLLAAVPEDTVAPLVAALRDRELTGVNGRLEVVDRFLDVARPPRSDVAFQMRLYRLGTLRPPAAEGSARVAREEDLELATDWLSAFERDAGVHATNTEAAARERIAGDRLWLWEHGGEPVSLAARTAPAVGVSRIAPVYTPAEHRRHGYGAAVTAACTADALAPGAHQLVLFTDHANPTSNSIYQQIGFEPVGDYSVVRF
jgi:predicted GNAT family acetyltransferase